MTLNTTAVIVGNVCTLFAMAANAFSATRKTAKGVLGVQNISQGIYGVSALVLGGYSGLRIPANALRLRADGQSGVYCLVGFTADFKPVDVVYRGDGYTLVRAAEGATGGDILRSGDEVIVTTSELYDGKVVQ